MDLKYQIIRSRRKTCAIQIYPDGRVVVRAPMLMPKYKIERFIESKKDWIMGNLQKSEDRRRDINSIPKISDDQIEKLRAEAKEYIPKRAEFYADIMGVSYGNITIKKLKSRWGSCSSKKNLNFNCLLMLTPKAVIDYVVVHELCHLKQMNHSKAFWQEVERALPNYKSSYKWLRDNGKAIIYSAFEN